MSAVQTTAQPELRNPPSATARRVAAAASALFGVALFLTVAVIDVPHDASDAELVTWWQDSGNRTAGVLSGAFAICAAALIAVVVGYLAEMSATRRSPHWRAFARSMGGAVTALWLVTGAVRATVGHMVDVMDEPLPDVGVLRIVTALNYTLLGLSGMAALALAILALSGLILRTQALDRWVAVVGVVCGSLMLLATLAQYGAYTTPLGILWAFCLAVAIWRRPTESSHLHARGTS